MSSPDGCQAARSRGPPSLRSAAALLLLLPLLPPPAAAAPLPLAAGPDSSGEAEPEEAGARRAALPDCEALAWLLHARAARLQEEVGTGPPGGGWSSSRGRGAAARRRGATRGVGVSPLRCARSSPSARTAWRCWSRTTSTSPR